MREISKSFIKEKNSKFYGYMYDVKVISEINDIINQLKIENKKAKHICYAYKINNLERKFEDKEPSNTAGKPLLDIINYNNLNNVLIVVIRYFGGSLLGVGLLTRTYSRTARALIK